MERLGGRTRRRVRFVSGGWGRDSVAHDRVEEDGECRGGQSTHGVAWVCAIGGVAVAHDRAGDMRWVACRRTERVGAQSVWVGEWAGCREGGSGTCGGSRVGVPTGRGRGMGIETCIPLGGM